MSNSPAQTDAPSFASGAIPPYEPEGWRPGAAFARDAAGLAAVFLAATTLVFVDETEFVIVERLGRVSAVYDHPEARGLQFKWCWPIGTARRFDARTQWLAAPGREAFTRDRKNVIVEAALAWRIAPGDANVELADRPVVQFFRSFGSMEAASARLSSRLQSVLANRLSQTSLSDLVHADDDADEPAPGSGGLMQLADAVRDELQRSNDSRPANAARGEATARAVQLIDLKDGLDVAVVRIRRLGLPAANLQAVFERMRSERRKIADGLRSEGQAAAAAIRSKADRAYGEAMAVAEREAQSIRGRGEAEALSLLQAVQSRDPELYELWQTLEAYQTLLSDKTTLVLSAAHPVFQLLLEGPSLTPKTPPRSSTATPPTDAAAPASGDR